MELDLGLQLYCSVKPILKYRSIYKIERTNEVYLDLTKLSIMTCIARCPYASFFFFNLLTLNSNINIGSFKFPWPGQAGIREELFIE